MLTKKLLSKTQFPSNSQQQVRSHSDSHGLNARAAKNNERVPSAKRQFTPQPNNPKAALDLKGFQSFF